MKKFFSPSTAGFYDEGVHGSRLIDDGAGKLIENPGCGMPLDVIEISNDDHIGLLAGQSGGKRIVAGKDGYPVLADLLPPTTSEIAAVERQWRDGVLNAAIWLRERHRDQQEIGAGTTLTAGQFAELLVYMQALRDWPQAEAFPDIEHRPGAPSWLSEQAMK